MADESSTQQPVVKVYGRTGAPQCHAVREGAMAVTFVHRYLANG